MTNEEASTVTPSWSVYFKSRDDISSIYYGFGDVCNGYIIGDDRIVTVTKDKWW